MWHHHSSFHLISSYFVFLLSFSFVIFLVHCAHIWRQNSHYTTDGVTINAAVRVGTAQSQLKAKVVFMLEFSSTFVLVQFECHAKDSSRQKDKLRKYFEISRKLSRINYIIDREKQTFLSPLATQSIKT